MYSNIVRANQANVSVISSNAEQKKAQKYEEDDEEV